MPGRRLVLLERMRGVAVAFAVVIPSSHCRSLKSRMEYEWKRKKLQGYYFFYNKFKNCLFRERHERTIAFGFRASK